MKKTISKKLRTLKNLDWAWFIKYQKKQASVKFHFYRSKLKGEEYLHIDIDGLRFKMSFTHPYYHLFARRLQEGKHEKNTLIAWKRQSETKPEIVLDLGGYVGTYGIIAAAANPKSEVFIFEPDPTNFQQIERNIKLNDLKNAKVLPMAVSDIVGTVSFNNFPGGEGGNITKEGGDSSIKSTTIDQWIKENGKIPTLIKMDVEGAEYRALLGGRKLFTESKNLRMLLEVHYDYLQRYGDSQEKLWRLLEEYNYDHFYLDTTVWNDHYWIYKKNECP